MTKRKPQEKNVEFLNECNELEDRQKAFCEYYISTNFNGTQAAILAGYSKKTANVIASENLTKPNILKYIDKLKAERLERVHITHDDILKDLIEVKERCMQKAPVTFMGTQIKDKNGNNLWKFDAKGATKALELIGKHTGFFAEDNKQKQTIVNPVQNAYVMPDECKDAIKHIKDYIKND